MSPRKITINVQEPYLSYLLNGQKKVECRLNKGKIASIQKGDLLIIKPKKAIFKIIRKTLYNNFYQMIAKEGIKNVLPNKNNIREAVQVYYKFYTKAEEKKFGVIALEVKKYLLFNKTIKRD